MILATEYDHVVVGTALAARYIAQTVGGRLARRLEALARDRGGHRAAEGLRDSHWLVPLSCLAVQCRPFDETVGCARMLTQARCDTPGHVIGAYALCQHSAYVSAGASALRVHHGMDAYATACSTARRTRSTQSRSRPRFPLVRAQTTRSLDASAASILRAVCKLDDALDANRIPMRKIRVQR
jgi:hypothetical protein